MPLYFRKKIKTSPNTWLNLSKTGVSGSARAGRVTVSSRGRVSVRLGKGLTWRSGR